MGPNYSISTACATSNYCILNAANHIIRGEAVSVFYFDTCSWDSRFLKFSKLSVFLYCYGLEVWLDCIFFISKGANSFDKYEMLCRI